MEAIKILLLIVRSLIIIVLPFLQEILMGMETSYSVDEKEFLHEIGERIRKRRIEAGFSQENLAFECKLDRTYIGSVERGERNISIINLHKIAIALNVSISELLI